MTHTHDSKSTAKSGAWKRYLVRQNDFGGHGDRIRDSFLVMGTRSTHVMFDATV